MLRSLIVQLGAFVFMLWGAMASGASSWVQERTGELMTKGWEAICETTGSCTPSKIDPLVAHKWYLTLFYINQGPGDTWNPAYTQFDVSFHEAPTLRGSLKESHPNGKEYMLVGHKLTQKIQFIYKPVDEEGLGFGSYTLQRVADANNITTAYVGVGYVNACASRVTNTCDAIGPQKFCRAILTPVDMAIDNTRFRKFFDAPCIQFDGGLLAPIKPNPNHMSP